MNGTPETTAQLIERRFTIQGTLGSGATSVVYKAWDAELERVVALKVLHAALMGQGSLNKRFRREARLLARLHHPGIVRLYDYQADDERAFCVMEYVEGRPLSAITTTEGPMAPRRAAEIVAAVCDALATTHDEGIVHRDLKPANIVLTADGSPKLLDFGFGTAVGTMTALTRTTQIIGTPLYLPPEVCCGAESDERSDVYQMGLVLFHLLTARPPFTAETVEDLLDCILGRNGTEVGPPSAWEPRVPSELDAVVAACLERDPARRPASARELARRLRYWLNPSSAPAPAPAPPPPVPRASPRHRRAPLALFVVLAVVVIAALARRPGSTPSASSPSPRSSPSIRSVTLLSLDELEVRIDGLTAERFRLDVETTDRRRPGPVPLGTWELAYPGDGRPLTVRCAPAIVEPVTVRVTPLDDTGRPAPRRSHETVLSPDERLGVIFRPVERLDDEGLAAALYDLMRLRQSVAALAPTAPDLAQRLRELQTELSAILADHGLDSDVVAHLRHEIPRLLVGRDVTPPALARRLAPLRFLEAVLGTNRALPPPFGDVSRQMGFEFGTPTRWPSRTGWHTVADGAVPGPSPGLRRWMTAPHVLDRREQNELTVVLNETLAVDTLASYRPTDEGDRLPGFDDLVTAVSVPFPVAPPSAAPWPPRRCLLELDLQFFVPEYRLAVAVNDGEAVELVDWGDPTDRGAVERVAVPLDPAVLVAGTNRLSFGLDTLPGRHEPVVPLCLLRYRVLVR